jgi:hypothetical protein
MMETEDRGALYGWLEASMWEFPLAVQKWMLGMGQESGEVEAAVLKAFQAWTNLANQSVERVSQAQGFVSLMTSSVKHFVQCQRVARELVESFLPGVEWFKSQSQASGAEIEELREAVAKLRRDLRQLTAKVNLMDGLEGARNGAGLRR